MIHAAHQRKKWPQCIFNLHDVLLSDFLLESIFHNALVMQIFIFTLLLAFIHFGFHVFFHIWK